MYSFRSCAWFRRNGGSAKTRSSVFLKSSPRVELPRGKKPSIMTSRSSVPCQELGEWWPPRCSPRPHGPSWIEITPRFGRMRGSLQLPAEAERPKSSSCVTRATHGCATRFTTPPESPFKRIRPVEPCTRRSVRAATDMHVLCAVSPIVYYGFSLPCSAPGPCTTTATCAGYRPAKCAGQKRLDKWWGVPCPCLCPESDAGCLTGITEQPKSLPRPREYHI